MRRTTLSVASLAIALLAPIVHADQKRPIDRADQLPVHSYAVPKVPSAMLHDDAAVAALAESLRTDLEADLAAYDIRDDATLKSYYRALSTIAMLEHRTDVALDYEGKARLLEDKPAARILSGLTLRPLVAAEKAGATGAAAAFSTAFAAEIARVPYDSVQTELKSNRARLETLSPAIIEGSVASQIDPAAKAGRISKDLAVAVVSIDFALRDVLPHRDEMVKQLSTLIDAHAETKPDIWQARDVSLDDHTDLTPVVVAISDVGTDTDLFPGRVWTNAKEVPGNGKDDDKNGYVDDVHGIAWSWDGKPLSSDLRKMLLSPSDLTQTKQNMKGFLDMQAGLESPDAQEVKHRLAALSKDDVKPFMENMSFYSVYAHGTHVAGIAARGNPAVRLLVDRNEFPYQMVPPAPTAAWANGFAHAMERTVAYYRTAGVRVVNMSWGFSSGELEQELNVNAAGKSQEERHKLAIQYYDTVKRAFGAAIAKAPEILFVSAAGNSNESNKFNETIPASFDMPNTITVGAVDKAGDEAAFTSYGKVEVYANGYEVESVLPGGDKQSWSGTSMASPQVVNLAAKLLAVHPTLSAAEVKKLIVDGADAKDMSGGRSIKLLNEARSFQLASAAQP